MKKICLGVLIAIFVLFGSFFGVKAFCRSATAVRGVKNGGEGISSRVSPAGAGVGSLPSALKSVVSKTLGANDPHYRLSRSGAGYRAVNNRNRLSAAIGLNGFRVRSGANEWGLRLAAWGRGRSLQKVAAGKVVSNSNRVTINRGGIAEWWVNGPLGIEQGWTVANRPYPTNKRGRLTLLLTQSGDLRAQALSSGSSLSVSTVTGRKVLRYAGLAAYDKTGRRLPAHFETTRQTVRVVVDDAGAVYPVRIDPWVQAAELTSSDGAAKDSFGYSVAVSSDGSTVVVGAWHHLIGYALAGEVDVFRKPASGWANATETARLTGSPANYTSGLGLSVAVSSNGATVAAAGIYQTADAPDGVGAVFVFKEPASGWANETQTAVLTPYVTSSDNSSLWSVAVSSDGATVVAGNPFETVGGAIWQGAVYVFKEPASGWADETETAELTASDGVASDQLGYSVAVSPDGATIVSGAPGAATVFYSGSGSTVTTTQYGAVYVFKEPPSGWANGTQAAKLTTTEGFGGLGHSVAVSSDGTTVVAGEGTIVVNNVTSPGNVFVFEEPASGWANETQTAKLNASGAGSSCDLGHSVAVTPDGTTIVAGSICTDQPGAVYVFKESPSGWMSSAQTGEFTASNGFAEDWFGNSVAVSSDGTTVVAGAPDGRLGVNSPGAAYVFQSGGSLWENAISTGGGWYYLDWFGSFNTNNSPWIYHQDLGWLYPAATSTASIWFYDPQWDGSGGWWWTGSSFFPWVYSTSEKEWLYFDAKDSTPGQRWFFTAGGQASTH